jgi:hypothetical protein
MDGLSKMSWFILPEAPMVGQRTLPGPLPAMLVHQMGSLSCLQGKERRIQAALRPESHVSDRDLRSWMISSQGMNVSETS